MSQQAAKLSVEPALIEQAIRLVFGTQIGEESKKEICLISKGALHSAFRKRSLMFHPDRADHLGVEPQKLNELFKRFHGAYRLLSRLIEGDIIPGDSNSARHDADTVYAKSSPPEQRQDSHRAPRSDRKRTFSGPLPEKPLRLVQYLYYSGLIDWQTMIDSIAWQMTVRPKIGQIGRTYGFLNHAKVIEVIKARKMGELFGNVALNAGYLTRMQLLAMIGKQRNLNLPIGRYFIEKELFSRDELGSLIQENNQRNIWVKLNR